MSKTIFSISTKLKFQNEPLAAEEDQPVLPSGDEFSADENSATEDDPISKYCSKSISFILIFSKGGHHITIPFS